MRSVAGTIGTERLVQYDSNVNQPVRIKRIMKTETGNGNSITSTHNTTSNGTNNIQEVNNITEFMSCIDAAIDQDGSQTGEAIVKLDGPYSGYVLLTQS